MGTDASEPRPRTAPGVLLVNLGTPGEATPQAVRRYLKQFLSDPRVVELPRGLWLPLLYGVILPVRSRLAAGRYAQIWTEQGSPLAWHSEALREAVQARLSAQHGSAVPVALGMRYGKPSIATALDQLKHCDRLVVLPLYPQYAASTTGSAFDCISAVLRSWRHVPALHFINSYASYQPWIAAVAESVREFQARRGKPERLLFSYHGLPQKQIDAGDPYALQCELSTQLIVARLGLKAEEWAMSFQSRLGRGKWLQPYTLDTLKGWGRKGIGHVQVICPGFAVDCLETLEEIKVMNRDAFLKAGGERLDYIPALNARPLHASLLVELLKTEGFD